MSHKLWFALKAIKKWKQQRENGFWSFSMAFEARCSFSMIFQIHASAPIEWFRKCILSKTVTQCPLCEVAHEKIIGKFWGGKIFGKFSAFYFSLFRRLSVSICETFGFEVLGKTQNGTRRVFDSFPSGFLSLLRQQEQAAKS